MIHRLGYTQQQLYHGALLGTIAHAVWVAKEPLLAAMQSWHGHTYLLNDMSGTIATITFDNEHVVAVFFDANSSRNPIASNQRYKIETYFEGLPDGVLQSLKAKALDFMLQDYHGETRPIVTAAFWSEGRGNETNDNELIASEPWDQLWSNGAHIISTQLLNLEQALAAWKDEFTFSSEQLACVKSLYQRKVLSKEAVISLTEQEKNVLASTNQEGQEACQKILGSINIDY
ncbi:MAG: hypothetical protein V4525_16145 [Pseudomonadota bacterium]